MVSVDVVVLVVMVKIAVVDLVRIGMPQFDEILLLLVEEERKFGIIEGQWWWQMRRFQFVLCFTPCACSRLVDYYVALVELT